MTCAAPAAQLPDQPGVDRAEAQLAAPPRRSSRRAVRSTHSSLVAEARALVKMPWLISSATRSAVRASCQRSRDRRAARWRAPTPPWSRAGWRRRWRRGRAARRRARAQRIADHPLRRLPDVQRDPAPSSPGAGTPRVISSYADADQLAAARRRSGRGRRWCLRRWRERSMTRESRYRRTRVTAESGVSAHDQCCSTAICDALRSLCQAVTPTRRGAARPGS